MRRFLFLVFASSLCWAPFAQSAQEAELKSATVAVVVAPSDSAAIPATRAIYVGVSGDVKVDLASSGSAIVFTAVPVGMLHISAVKIYAIGTTATNMVALY